jgi:hypothetical protein
MKREREKGIKFERRRNRKDEGKNEGIRLKKYKRDKGEKT